MQEHYFIIGDVHGCLKTFRELLDHWNPEREILIQLGDLIDRGAYSPQTIQYCMELDKKHAGNAIFLRGNHEQMLIDYYADISTSWLSNGGRGTLLQFSEGEQKMVDVLPWIKQRNLFYETEHLFISHAGLTGNTDKSSDPRNPEGMLWNRTPLKNIGKVQVIGHTPLNDGKPAYNAKSNSWNIDTGAYKSICLTGIKLDHLGNFLESYSVPTIADDLLQ